VGAAAFLAGLDGPVSFGLTEVVEEDGPSEPAGGAGGGLVGNTIAPRDGACDAHRL
jgi:hypothetical protein